MNTKQIGIELEALMAADKDKKLYPKKALAWARKNKTSALHAALEWNDRKAGEQWRLSQIRELAKICVVNVAGETMVYSLSIDRRAGGGYRHVDDIVARQDLSDVLLQDALNELERMQLRYQRVQMLTAVWRAAAGVRAKAKKKGKKKSRSAKMPPPPRGGSTGREMQV